MIENGNLTLGDGVYAPGETLEYTCIDDHGTRHETITECQNDFTWSLDSDGLQLSCVPGAINLAAKIILNRRFVVQNLKIAWQEKIYLRSFYLKLLRGYCQNEEYVSRTEL